MTRPPGIEEKIVDFALRVNFTDLPPAAVRAASMRMIELGRCCLGCLQYAASADRAPPRPTDERRVCGAHLGLAGSDDARSGGLRQRRHGPLPRSQ